MFDFAPVLPQRPARWWDNKHFAYSIIAVMWCAEDDWRTVIRRWADRPFDFQQDPFLSAARQADRAGFLSAVQYQDENPARTTDAARANWLIRQFEAAGWDTVRLEHQPVVELGWVWTQFSRIYRELSDTALLARMKAVARAAGLPEPRLYRE